MESVYTRFGIENFRVECPVCKFRRHLTASEKNDALTLGAYHSFQFCKSSCKDRANEQQKMKVEKSKLDRGEV
jgi:hypothetical protein